MRTLVLPFLLLLAGCAGSLNVATPADVYDFGQMAENDIETAAPEMSRRLSLDVRAAPWLDEPGIDYRLAYGDPLRRSQYTGSRWAAPPALLLTQQLRRQLGIAIVDSVAADCVLRVELQEFSQVFAAPLASSGVLRGQVSLIDGKRRLIAARDAGIECPADTPNAAGGARALVEAGRQLGRQIADWLRQLEREGGLENCRPRPETGDSP
jgi:cholesterol transport system auxiliary component